jgi:GTP-binding protein
MFDKVEIIIRAGKGGDGAVSFRHEKYVPFGGPDGGDGGDGGDVEIVADSAVTDLRVFKRKKFYRAGDGKDGAGRKKHGRKGGDLILAVPVGTMVSYKTQIGNNPEIIDLEHHGKRVVIAKGGKGGVGNIHFTSSTNQAPHIAQVGEVGEEKTIILEMRLIADVGIIGYPNVGKSAMLAAVTAANPKIDSYPFTTRTPILGVAEVGKRAFLLAEIPGLISGAYLGRGLGRDFLRHVVRTKIIIHLIDGKSASPVEDMIKVNSELSLFDSALAKKPQLVVVNKIDLLEVRSRLDEIKEAFSIAETTALFISAYTGEGIPELMAEVVKMLEQVSIKKEAGEIAPRKVFYPQPRMIGVSVHKEGNTFVVVAPGVERIVDRTDITSSELQRLLNRHLKGLGVSKALEKAGANAGDRVRCGNFEWEWQ